MADAKQGKTEEFCNGSSQSRMVLAKPRLGGFGSSLPTTSNKSSNPFGSVLRPPQLKPALNPFFKVATPEETKDSKEVKEDSSERLKEEKSSEESEAPKFVPLGSANASSRSNSVTQPQPATTTSNASGFVFGQNLSERVMMQENVNNGAVADHTSTNGSTELLFTNAAASVKDNNQEAEPSTSEQGSGETSLAAAAAEYERIHARPPPPAATVSHTGEEDEINVLQTTCRLFAWESGSWRERGRGVLRLNDAAHGGGARLVVRVVGSLRVVLNTKLWPDMVVELAGTKSLRITASDAQQQVKLFLIMGAPVDITQLHRALTSRVAVSKRTSAVTQCAQNATSQKAAERLEADYTHKADESGENTEQNRLESTQKTEEYESNVDGMVEDSKTLKRKEPIEDATSPKRQCPEIVTE